MPDDFRIEYVSLRRGRDVAAITRFLERFGLGFDADVDFTVAARDQEGALVGTGSSQGDVLRNIAVDESLRGAGVTSVILSTLMQEMSRRGITHYFIFTRPEKSFLFANLGFAEIAKAEPYAALLESGLGSVASYCETVAKTVAHLPPQRAALVINGNPFTKGHRALIEKTASECPGVIVFVVSEDRSVFPSGDRLDLITKGVADLANVAVVEGGKYIISAATFPTYFTHARDHVKAQTRLDVSLFARQIAPRLGITDRYIGEEPYCPVTAEYNEAMREILPAAGVGVHVVPRFAVGGETVSASKVRALLQAGKWRQAEGLVPAVTWDYLCSERGKIVLKALRSQA